MKDRQKSQSSSTRQLADTDPGRDYDVGYKKPPVETRFQPGPSGNPRGRQTGSENRKLNDEETLAEIIPEESKRMVNLQQAGQVITLTSERAVVRSIIGRAIQGNPSAQRAFLSPLSKLDTPQDDTWNETLRILVGYKNGWKQILAERKRRGTSPPLPDPLPERIEIDEDNRTAYLIENSAADTKHRQRQRSPRRELGAEDYDCLKRAMPCPQDGDDLRPQRLLGQEDIDRLPDHIRVRLLAGLQGLQDYADGKFVSVTPPRPIYDSEYVTPCGHEMPLHGMRCYGVEQEDAEILLTQGWSLCDPHEWESGANQTREPSS